MNDFVVIELIEHILKNFTPPVDRLTLEDRVKFRQITLYPDE